MRFRLRTLLIAAGVLPPLIAGAWYLATELPVVLALGPPALALTWWGWEEYVVWREWRQRVSVERAKRPLEGEPRAESQATVNP